MGYSMNDIGFRKFLFHRSIDQELILCKISFLSSLTMGVLGKDILRKIQVWILGVQVQALNLGLNV